MPKTSSIRSSVLIEHRLLTCRTPTTYHSTDLLTTRGVAHLVVHGTSGSTSYMVVQRRDGPRRLRDHDDDDDDELEGKQMGYRQALPCI